MPRRTYPLTLPYWVLATAMLSPMSRTCPSLVCCASGCAPSAASIVGADLAIGARSAPTIEAAEGAQPEAQQTKDGQVLLIGDNIAVANTQYGKVRGYVLRGINYFLGIPFG